MGKDPKEFDFQKQLEGFIKAEDDEEKQSVMKKLDIEGFKSIIDNDYVNPIVDYRREKEREKAREEAMQEAQKATLQEIGIEAETIDEAKAWRKRLESTTTEKDETLSKYEKQMKELQEKAEEAETFRTQYEKEKNIRGLMETGVKPKYAEDAYLLAEARTSEEKDLSAALDDVKESHAHMFEQSGAGGKVPGDDPGDDEDDLKHWEEKYGVKLNKK